MTLISTTPQTYLDKLWARGKTFLGVDRPILGGAMTWVSEPNLVAAISNAGGFGVIAAGAMPPTILEEVIRTTRSKTAKPFGVNLITLHPDLASLIDVCIQEAVSHVVLAGGLPPSWAIEKLKNANAKVMCFAPALVVAKKLHRQGVDGLILEGMEAGGHIGPVSINVLAQEILPAMKDDLPIFVAGGIGRGETIVNFLLMGAVGCQLGTRFVCASESTAHPNFKRAFIRGHARDATPSVQLDPRFPVIPVRALKNKATEDFMGFQRRTIEEVDKGELTMKEAQLAIEHFWAGALRRAVVDGDVENGSLMAGQSVGMVQTEQPVKEILEELEHQALTYITQLQNQTVA